MVPPSGQDNSERRFEARMLCADLVDIRWKGKAGTQQRAIANLEDISASGACLQLEVSLPLRANVEIAYPGGKLYGHVRYCVYREIGYFVGVRFDSGTKWSKRVFKPMHMLDPRALIDPHPSPRPKDHGTADPMTIQ